MLFSYSPYLRLWKVPYWKKCLLQRLLPYPCEEIRLILVRIRSTLEIKPAVRLLDPCIMSHGDIVSIELERIIKKSIELDLLITHHIRVWSPSGPVLLQEITEHPVPVLLFKVYSIIWNSKLSRNSCNILVILGGSTYACLILLIPVFHENTYNIISLLLEYKRRNRRIHPTAHSKHYFFLHFLLL